MFEIARNNFSIKMKRIMRLVAVRRFARREDGAAAVEFGLILLPFMGIIFAIMKSALVFFADQTLETVVANSARLIMTGQAQKSSPALTKDTFKDAVCAHVFAMFDCTKLTVNVQTYATFAGITYTPPLDVNGNFNSSKFGYVPGGPGDIVVVQLFYTWPIFVSLMNLNSLTNMNGHNRLLVATAAFRNEPF